MASVFVDVHLPKAKLTLFCDSNCFLIASTVSQYTLQQMLLRLVAGGRTSSLQYVVYDRQRSRFDIAFREISAETHANMR